MNLTVKCSRCGLLRVRADTEDEPEPQRRLVLRVVDHAQIVPALVLHGYLACLSVVRVARLDTGDAKDAEQQDPHRNACTPRL